MVYHHPHYPGCCLAWDEVHHGRMCWPSVPGHANPNDDSECQHQISWDPQQPPFEVTLKFFCHFQTKSMDIEIVLVQELIGGGPFWHPGPITHGDRSWCKILLFLWKHQDFQHQFKNWWLSRVFVVHSRLHNVYWMSFFTKLLFPCSLLYNFTAMFSHKLTIYNLLTSMLTSQIIHRFHYAVCILKHQAHFAAVFPLILLTLLHASYILLNLDVFSAKRDSEWVKTRN